MQQATPFLSVPVTVENPAPRLRARSCRSLILLCGLLAALTGVLSAAEPAELSLGTDGRIHLLFGGSELCSFTPLAADTNWGFSNPTTVKDAKGTQFSLKTGSGISGEATLTPKDGAAEALWNFVSANGVQYNALAVGCEITIGTLAGGTWQTADSTGTFPAQFGEAHLYNNAVTKVTVTAADGRSFTLSFPQPTPVLLQDNRKWGGTSFSVRIGRAAGQLAAGETYRLPMTIAIPGGVTCTADHPVTMAAGPDWIPLASDIETVPGSALDFSGNAFTDGPCGSHGRVIATPDGHFAYADSPGTPRRFYGANLCFSAQYLPKEQVDILLDRWLRMGYNTLRIHHYEFGLTKPEWASGFHWNAEQVDRLQYLIAGCAKRGIWVTTDLYVSRPVAPEQIGLPAAEPYINNRKQIEADVFKSLIMVYDPAYQDWQKFTRQLLEQVNPYTGKRLAEEPALAWLSLINEGSIRIGSLIHRLPQWKTAWNKWLQKKWPARNELQAALGDLQERESPESGSVALPQEIFGDQPRQRACQMFLAETERETIRKMRAFLRDELKCPALLTNHNCFPNTVFDQAMRAEMDYVDDHFYVDHPQFLEAPWRLPSRCDNANPIREGAPGGTGSASLRIWGKPFAISEFNYSGPGRFRGMGGVLTGALAALQDWDVVWRFAYSHQDKDSFTPAHMDYFNLARDPLNRLADCAAVMLYLRRDLAPAPHSVATVVNAPNLTTAPASGKPSELAWLAWTTRVGTVIPGVTPPRGLLEFPFGQAADLNALTPKLVQAGIAGADARNPIRSETGSILIDKGKGVLCIDTPRSAGGYADPGEIIDAARSGVKVEIARAGAMVFIMSLDKTPVRESPRLLVTHLTDLQNTGARYGEAARQTMLAWGGLPWLVHDGEAKVSVALQKPQEYKVWALSTGGRRLEEIPATADAAGLHFTLQVRGKDGARMLYEIARQ